MRDAAMVHRFGRRKGVLAGAVLLALACTGQPSQGQAAAADPHERSPAVQDRGAQGGDVMQMIQDCRDETEKAGRAVDEALREIGDLRESRDARKLRAALDKAEASLRDARSQMRACESVMTRLSGIQRGSTREQEQQMMPPDSVKR